jgi:hypothetical protein
LLEPDTRAFYCDMMHRMIDAEVPFLIGGTFATERYTGMPRRTKDLDIFIRRSEFDRVMEVAAQAGYRTEMTAPHWLGKIFHGRDFIDVIFGSGNKVCPVDDAWFEFAVPDTVLGVAVRLCPVEEMIWSKSFIMERERFDGGDVIHLFRARPGQIDWQRLVSRFGPYWQVLLSHLILLQFAYPNEKDLVPRDVMDALLRRLTDQEPAGDPHAAARLCQGTLLSKRQYHIDIESWGYEDARLIPPVGMTQRELNIWNGVV